MLYLYFNNNKIIYDLLCYKCSNYHISQWPNTRNNLIKNNVFLTDIITSTKKKKHNTILIKLEKIGSLFFSLNYKIYSPISFLLDL